MGAFQEACPEAFHGSVPPATKVISRMSYLDVSPDPESIKIGLSVLRNGRCHHHWSNPRTKHPSPMERSMGAFRRSVRPAGPAGRAGHHLHTFLVMGNLRLQLLLSVLRLREDPWGNYK